MLDGGMCETCHEVPGYIVHHIEPLNPENILDETVSLNHDKLKFDCHVCHNKERTPKEVERYYFNDAGEIVARPPMLTKEF